MKGYYNLDYMHKPLFFNKSEKCLPYTIYLTKNLLNPISKIPFVTDGLFI
ncbi:hypothetical protein SAMN05216327_10768 [Dyadobacter sp. SG02]|nr:hypothetical protein SAMN05216327_10768 [Dyadobacter sp. SG02]